jgi:hypothetical protein
MDPYIKTLILNYKRALHEKDSKVKVEVTPEERRLYGKIDGEVLQERLRKQNPGSLILPESLNTDKALVVYGDDRGANVISLEVLGYNIEGEKKSAHYVQGLSIDGNERRELEKKHNTLVDEFAKKFEQRLKIMADKRPPKKASSKQESSSETRAYANAS